MVCCSITCPKREECGLTIKNYRCPPGTFETVEDLSSFGSGSFGIDKDGNVHAETHYVCGPRGDFALFIRSDLTDLSQSTAIRIQRLA